MENTINQKAWYNRRWLVILLCILFFPVGLVALWKSNVIHTGWKVVWTALIAIIVIGNFAGLNNNKGLPTEIQNSPSVSEPRKEEMSAEKLAIIEKLKEKVKRDWPNNFATQELMLNQQIESYDYMLTVTDETIKKKVERDWPLDFTLQKLMYNQELEAKERLN